MLKLEEDKIKITAPKSNSTMTHHPFNSTIEQSQIAEAKKIHDREMREIRSTNLIQCYSDRKNKNRIHKIKYVNDIIQDLECYGPAGLIHIAVLSSIIERPIKIWNAKYNSLNKIIGRRKTGHPIDIEYHTSNSEGVGHWTLRGGKDPDNVVTDLNSCLFSVIGSQIEQDPLKLRKWTVFKLKNNFQNLTKWVNKIKLKRSDKMIFMIGGARYIGEGPENAKEVLNRSQNEKSHESKCMTKGHARGHASGASSDCIQTIQQFSKNLNKTGFLSRTDQDLVTHLALKTKKAQETIAELNQNCEILLLDVSAIDLKTVDLSETEISQGKYHNLPQVGKWKNGIQKTYNEIVSVTLVLRHHYEKFCDPNTDVFILTCFPKVIGECKEKECQNPLEIREKHKRQKLKGKQLQESTSRKQLQESTREKKSNDRTLIGTKKKKAKKKKEV